MVWWYGGMLCMAILRTSHINYTAYRAIPHPSYRAAAGKEILKYNLTCRVSQKKFDVTAWLAFCYRSERCRANPSNFLATTKHGPEHDYIGGCEYLHQRILSMRVYASYQYLRIGRYPTLLPPMPSFSSMRGDD